MGGGGRGENKIGPSESQLMDWNKKTNPLTAEYIIYVHIYIVQYMCLPNRFSRAHFIPLYCIALDRNVVFTDIKPAHFVLKNDMTLHTMKERCIVGC